MFLALLWSTAAFSFPVVAIREAVPIGGIQQWIEIKGANTKRPILLFLHGGPGNSVMKRADIFTRELQKHFLVVQWDQRNAGETHKLNPSPEAITVALMTKDAVEMIQHLTDRFQQEKIFLMGHSWGGFLALQVAREQPQLLHACLAINPMINQLESERLALVWMKEQAAKQKNQLALSQLDQVKVPFENDTQLYFHRHWLNRLGGSATLNRAFVEQWASQWLPLFNEASSVNLFEQTPELACPAYFFIGGRDYQTHHTLATAFVDRLRAEKKELFWFPNSGHSLNLTEPKRLQELVISILNQSVKP